MDYHEMIDEVEYHWRSSMAVSADTKIQLGQSQWEEAASKFDL